MYSNTFSSQWDNLVTVFLTETSGYAPEMMTPKRLNEWYRANSFRWSSIAEKEGILLDNEHNSTLSSELRSAIESFSFKAIPMPTKPSPLPFLAAGAGGAAAAALVLKLTLRTRTLFAVIVAIACVLLALIWYARQLDQYSSDSNAKIHNGYADQLKAYKPVLVSICKRYE